MPFAKGRKKTGGRKKGIPAIVTASFSAAEACRKLGVDPFEVLAKMAAEDDMEISRPAAETLCRYLQAQPRQLQVEVRRTPEQIAAELLADPELRRRVAECLAGAERGSLPFGTASQTEPGAPAGVGRGVPSPSSNPALS